MTLQPVQPGRRTVHSLAVFISLALLALILAACTAAQPAAAPIQAPAAAPTQAPVATQAKPAAPAPAGNLTQSAEAGAVTVDITPLNLADAKASALAFKVAMNTHSVELGVDLAKLAVLQVGANEVAAETWQTPTGGGHHVEGTLDFPGATAAGKPILEGATSVTVVIRNLAGIPERKFTWELDKFSSATGLAATAAMPMSGIPGGSGMGMGAGNAMTGT